MRFFKKHSIHKQHTCNFLACLPGRGDLGKKRKSFIVDFCTFSNIFWFTNNTHAISWHVCLVGVTLAKRENHSYNRFSKRKLCESPPKVTAFQNQKLIALHNACRRQDKKDHPDRMLYLCMTRSYGSPDRALKVLDYQVDVRQFTKKYEPFATKTNYLAQHASWRLTFDFGTTRRSDPRKLLYEYKLRERPKVFPTLSAPQGYKAPDAAIS